MSFHHVYFLCVCALYTHLLPSTGGLKIGVVYLEYFFYLESSKLRVSGQVMVLPDVTNCWEGSGLYMFFFFSVPMISQVLLFGKIMHCKFLVILFIVFLFFSFFSSACEFRPIERIGTHGKQNPDFIYLLYTHTVYYVYIYIYIYIYTHI